MLDDLLTPHLRVVFCGTAAGAVSAARGEYYAGSGNKFWPILFETGLISERLRPSQYRELLRYDIGLTDIVKNQAGSDASIDFSESNPRAVKEKIIRNAPKALAFNGKKAAQIFLERKDIEYGLQAEGLGVTKLFVAPSTSNNANGYWDASYWHQLARLVSS